MSGSASGTTSWIVPSRALLLSGFVPRLSLYASNLLTSFRTQRLKPETGLMSRSPVNNVRLGSTKLTRTW